MLHEKDKLMQKSAGGQHASDTYYDDELTGLRYAY